nr:MAG TPA: hypothetical protein [Caudoviricetes sp.]
MLNAATVGTPNNAIARVILINAFNHHAFHSLSGPCPFTLVYHACSPFDRTCKNIFGLLGWGGVALRCSPAKVSGRYHLDALNSAEKNQKKNKTKDNIIWCTPLYHAKTLVCGALAALSINIRVRCLQKLAIESDALHVLVNGLCRALYHLRRTVHHVDDFSLYGVIHCFKFFNEPLIFAVCVHFLFKISHFYTSFNSKCIQRIPNIRHFRRSKNGFRFF